MVFLIEAIAADLRGDAHAAATLLASVDLASIPTPLGIFVLRDLMSKLQIIGESARAVTHCDVLRRLAGDDRVEFTIALAHWANGTPEPVVENWERLRHRTIEQNHTDFLTWVYSTTIDASLGIVSDFGAMPNFGRRRRRWPTPLARRLSA